jgi:predicted O-methyltransferase YrrM
MAMAAATGRANGFTIPYRYADAVEAPVTYPALEPIFKAAEPAFGNVLAASAAHLERFSSFGGEPPAPRFEQDWFPRLDGAAAYALIRTLRPARIVEIGSGHSTRFIARAAADAGSVTRITAIDPAPRATLDGLPIEFVRGTLQQAGLGPFAGLSAGDIVFIDSSHILMPGTDVDMLLNAVLPTLPGGVHVHVHDVFLPDGYPATWAWRGYNEQNAVAGLIAGGGYRLQWSSHYVASRMRAALDASGLAALPLLPGAYESSLWLVKAG